MGAVTGNEEKMKNILAVWVQSQVYINSTIKKNTDHHHRQCQVSNLLIEK